jgi:hypothetical protein
MSRWRNLNQWMFDLYTFYYLEGLHLYVWILLNVMYVGQVQLGSILFGARPDIQSIGKFREVLFFNVRMTLFCKRLESEKYEYEGVLRLMPMNDLACGDHFYWMGMSVKKRYDDSGSDRIHNKADSGRSSCGEKHVNRVRK